MINQYQEWFNTVCDDLDPERKCLTVSARIAFLIEEGDDIEYALENYEDVDFYEGMNLKRLAEHFVEEGLFGEIPDSIVGYLDYAAIGRDLGFDGFTETPDGCFRRS
jgi:hypothetical protein